MKKKTRIYVSSEICTSQELPDFLKDMLDREDCFYRVTKVEKNLTKKEKRESQESVKKEIKAFHDGKEISVPVVVFDRKGKRYFAEFSTLDEVLEFFTDFSEHCNLGVGIDWYDPDDDNDSNYLEINFGLEMPPCYAMELKDEVLLMQEELAEMYEAEEEE